ncbi:flagellar basal-body rod protein FlgF [candidate division KSB1 bacterium 4484_188]|nr:MAG: flagellar basal-body rod protein FlgF [candidate division KSB1 bacterium 4484_188]HFE64939.1 flagellar basal-body rod protein FlgF [Caldithrix sp.]
MIKGLNVSKAGMLPRQRQLEIDANNLANINTIGYKKDEVFFRHLIDSLQASDEKNAKVSSASGEVITDFSSGSLRETGNPLDLAIVGDGFFVIDTPEGNVFTRNGNFSLDADGRLTTQDGYSVLGSGGEIQITGNEVRISEDGSILVDGQATDTLRVVRFENPTLLTKIGGTYFMDENDAGMMDVESTDLKVRQGYLEGSNVTGIKEIVQMIEIYRQFEMGQRAISTQDQTLEKLINDGGRLP